MQIFEEKIYLVMVITWRCLGAAETPSLAWIRLLFVIEHAKKEPQAGCLSRWR
jgi:hypothetical protein